MMKRPRPLTNAFSALSIFLVSMISAPIPPNSEGNSLLE
jgi:hypothetical protein